MCQPKINANTNKNAIKIKSGLMNVDEIVLLPFEAVLRVLVVRLAAGHLKGFGLGVLGTLYGFTLAGFDSLMTDNFVFGGAFGFANFILFTFGLETMVFVSRVVKPSARLCVLVRTTEPFAFLV
jgi:hypothetical protein